MMANKESLFSMIKGEDCTSLIISYNWENDDLQMELMKEWSNKEDWAHNEGKQLHKKSKKIGTSEVKKLVLKYNLDNYFDEVLYLIRTGRHEQVAWYYEPNHEARCLMAIHNGQHRHMVGNIRRIVPTKSEYDTLAATLNLSRIMTFRCAVAQVSCGGTYLSFQAPSANHNNIDSLFGFLKYLIERENSHWGVEPGFSQEEVDKLEKETSKVLTDRDPSEESFTSCAITSIYLVIKEALSFRYKSPNLDGKLIGVQGLNKIGSRLARKLLDEGADLIVCDLNSTLVENFLEENRQREKSITVVSPTDIGMQMGHVFSPCGQEQGGFLTQNSIREISYHIIVGGAVQLLQAYTQQEEITLAKRLLSKGVLYIPEWISNIGSVTYALALIEETQCPDVKMIQQKIEEILRPCVQEILKNSQSRHISPLEEAYERFTPLVYRARR